MKRRVILTFLLLFLPLSLLAADLPKPDPQAPVDLQADQLDFDQESGRYHAQGNVRLLQGPLTLTSDQLWWNQQTGEVEASGAVHFTGPGEELEGSRMRYSLRQGTGVVEDGQAAWQGESLHFGGKRLERLGPNRFRIYRGRFTLCDGKRPAWSIGARQADVTLGRYLTAKHALIYVKDIPIFYTPYFLMSVKSERESGFLMPNLGFSRRRGTQISLAWYQVLGQNMDATFYLDRLSYLGTGVGTEFRYIFGQSQRGELKPYMIFAEEGDNRWAGNWTHFGEISDSLRLVADAEYASRVNFYEDFGEVTGEYNKQKVISSLFASKKWGKAELTGQLKYIKDLEQEKSTPWQSLPHLDFSVAPHRVWRTPFYLGLRSSYTDFSRDGDSLGQRLMARPSIGLHSYLFSGLEFDSEYGYRLRRYNQLDESLENQMATSDFRARLASRLSRTYNGAKSRWLHSIEPEISYNYAESDKLANLPYFDRYDLPTEGNYLEYALVSHLNGKWLDAEGGQTQREVAWLKLSQNYDFQNKAKLQTQYSDLRTQLSLWPTTHSSLALDAYYDMDGGRVPDFSVSGTFADGQGNGLSTTYRKRRPASGVGQIENINLRVDAALLKPLYLAYEQRYDFLDTRQLEQVLYLDYRHQCWGLKVELRERDIDRSVMLTLSLKGLGEIGSVGKTYDRSYTAQ